MTPLQPPAPWLEVILASTVPLVVLGVIATRLWNYRIVNGQKIRGRGLGVRTIQFAAVATIVPTVAILALHGILQGDAVAAIFGGMIGYLLASIAKFDERERD